MKKKFIFAVLVMLAFGLSIGYANESSAQVPIEYTIYNKLKDGVDVYIRVLEMRRTSNNDLYYNDVIQVLTPVFFIKNGETKTFTADVSNCMKKNILYVEEYQYKENECYGGGYAGWTSVEQVLETGKVEFIIKDNF